MANVFSNASFAVLSVMETLDSNNLNHYYGSTVFIQRKPESDYGKITFSVTLKRSKALIITLIALTLTFKLVLRQM